MNMLKYSVITAVTLLVNLHMAGCEKTEPAKEMVSDCDSKQQFKVVGQVERVEGEVIKLPILFPSTSYFIKITSPLKNAEGYARLPLGVCNLPDNFKKEGLRVNFGGKLLWYDLPDNVSIDVSTQPFELSSIEQASTVSP
jgi:hypothetical protein